MFDDLFTTNVLLGIIAAVQVAFLLGTLVALLKLRSTVSQVQATVRDLEREHVRPLKAQAERILADVARISARVEAQTKRVDESVSSTLDVAERQVRRVKTAVDAVARETSAVATGFRAAVAAVTRQARTNGGASGRTHHAPPEMYPADVSREEDLHASFR